MHRIRFALRDDDISYFTRPEELETIYERIWSFCPISLSIVPFTVKWEKIDSHFKQENGRFPLGNNRELVSFIRNNLEKGKFGVALHGYDHKYLITESGRRIPECVWKKEEDLAKEVSEGKDYLEELFEVPLSTFVPPSGVVSKEAARSIAFAHLNIQGTMLSLRSISRNLDAYFARNYMLKVIYRLRYCQAYPFVMSYATHRELVGYELNPSRSFLDLKSAFDFCYKRKAPFSLSTHYWQMLKHKDMQHTLQKFLIYIDAKVSPTTLDGLFENGQ